jgi:FMN-dependent NADH-azoreductase
VPKLLHISASPRGEVSETIAMAKAFLAGHAERNPDVEVEEVDLFDGSLPAFGRLATGAKMAVFAGGRPSPEQTAEWDAARAVFARFDAADAYLFSVPMWNSGIPYVLKQWIDVVTQPGWVFGFDPETGYQGLIKGRRAAVMYASGVYSPGAPPAFGTDFHATYFDEWLRFAGFAPEDVATVWFQPTALTPTPDEDRAVALASARAVGSEFAQSRGFGAEAGKSRATSSSVS